MSILRKIFILGLFLCGVTLWQLKEWIYRPYSVESAIVLIEKGNGSHSVAMKLAEARLIKSPFLFKLAARYFGLDKSLQAGEYEFSGFLSIHDMIQKLANGDVVHHKITLPEGLTTAQILALIENDPLLSGEITLKVKEGELLPETYLFTRGETKDNIIAQAKAAMNLALDQAWQDREDHLPLKNPHQLLVLASIVEKETGIDSERGFVASVFINRLIKGMKLQTDPTVIYALTLGKSDLGRSLTKKDLSFDSPYNTYVYYGLPPEPICNPGKASLQAVSHPEVSNYFYFVASGNGGHNFSSSLNEHNQNVQKWLQNQKKVTK